MPIPSDGDPLESRVAALEDRLRALGSVVVAFSGGADSAYLLATALRVLGPDHVAGAVAVSSSLPASELDAVRRLATTLGVRLVEVKTHEMRREGYRRNDGDRCYFCKAELIDVLWPVAADLGFAAVATGTNADDLRAGFRPGIRAAAERGAVAPLQEAGLTKEEIRALSRRHGLPTWDKPAAACLSSRIAYGVEVSPSRLARVERAEAAIRVLLSDEGVECAQLRVRDLGNVARIELDRSALAVLEVRRTISARVVRTALDAGFGHAELDPRGFRSGSMNELLLEPIRYR